MRTFNKGTKVTDMHFGKGEVMEVGTTQAYVRFESGIHADVSLDDLTIDEVPEPEVVEIYTKPEVDSIYPGFTYDAPNGNKAFEILKQMCSK